jgi:hypothetical protein
LRRIVTCECDRERSRPHARDRAALGLKGPVARAEEHGDIVRGHDHVEAAVEVDCSQTRWPIAGCDLIRDRPLTSSTTGRSS